MTAKHKKRTKTGAGKGFFGWLIVITVVIAAAVIAVILISQGQKSVDNSLYPLKYESYVEKAAKEYDLDEALIYGVIKTESNFNPEAQSRVGAKGIMQIMPETFDWLQLVREVSGEYEEDDLLDPEISIDFGCYFLRYLLDLYGTEQAAVAAYNAGFVVGDWLEDSTYSSDGVTLDYIPYPETADYVEKVLSAKDKYNELYFNKNEQ